MTDAAVLCIISNFGHLECQHSVSLLLYFLLVELGIMVISMSAIINAFKYGRLLNL